MDFSYCQEHLDALEPDKIDFETLDVTDWHFDEYLDQCETLHETTQCDCYSLICVHHFRQQSPMDFKRFYRLLSLLEQRVEFKGDFFPGFRCIEVVGSGTADGLYVEKSSPMTESLHPPVDSETVLFIDSKERDEKFVIYFTGGRYYHCRGSVVQWYTVKNSLSSGWVVAGKFPPQDQVVQTPQYVMPEKAYRDEPGNYHFVKLYENVRWRDFLMVSEEVFYSLVGTDARHGVVEFTFEAFRSGSRNDRSISWYFVAKKMGGLKVMFTKLEPAYFLYEKDGKIIGRGRVDKFVSRPVDFFEALRIRGAQAQAFFDACLDGKGRAWEEICCEWLPRFRYSRQRRMYDLDFAGLYILRYWKRFNSYVGPQLDQQACLVNECVEALKDPAKYSLRNMLTFKHVMSRPVMTELLGSMSRVGDSILRVSEALDTLRKHTALFSLDMSLEVQKAHRIKLYQYLRTFAPSMKYIELDLIRMCIVKPPVAPDFVFGESDLPTEKDFGDDRRLCTVSKTGGLPENATLQGCWKNLPANMMRPHMNREVAGGIVATSDEYHADSKSVTSGEPPRKSPDIPVPKPPPPRVSITLPTSFNEPESDNWHRNGWWHCDWSANSWDTSGWSSAKQWEDETRNNV